MHIRATLLMLTVGLSIACSDEDNNMQISSEGGVNDAGFDGGAPLEPCEENATITGSVSGLGPVSVGLPAFRAVEASTKLWMRFGESDHVGFLYISTSTTFSDQRTEGSGLLVLPEAFGGHAVCAESTTTIGPPPSNGNTADILFEVDGTLGTCATAADTTDRFEVCIPRPGQRCEQAGGDVNEVIVTGMIDEQAIDFVQDMRIASIYEGRSGEVEVLFGDGRGATSLTPTANGYEGTLLWRGPDPRGPARLYCVQQAAVGMEGDALLTLTFEQMKLRGDCSHPMFASGQLTICL